MSCSNIIKLHTLQPQRVIIRAEITGAKSESGSGRPGPSQNRSLAYQQNGSAGFADHPQVELALSQAQEIVNRAKADAEAIIEEANEKAKQVMVEGYEKGYAEGMATARADALKDIQRIAELAANAAADMSRITLASEEGIVELALSIAEKIVGKSLAEDRTVLVAMVKDVLERLETMDVLRVRVNPEDLEILRPFWEEGVITQTGRGIDLVADPRVQMGGCIIDTSTSVVDAQIKTKLAEIERSFRPDLDVDER